MNIGDELIIDDVTYIVVDNKQNYDGTGLCRLQMKDPKPPFKESRLSQYLNSDKEASKYWILSNDRMENECE